jgi:hypothetical protein
MSVGHVHTVEEKALEILRRALDLLVEGDVKGAETLITDVPSCEDEYVSGFSASVRGILNALRSGDKEFLANRIRKSPVHLQNEIRRLKETMDSHLLTEWDRGYFDAWLDYLSGLRRALRQPDVEEYSVNQNPEE